MNFIEIAKIIELTLSDLDPVVFGSYDIEIKKAYYDDYVLLQIKIGKTMTEIKITKSEG